MNKQRLDGRGCGGVAVECEYYVDVKKNKYETCPDPSKKGYSRQCSVCPVLHPSICYQQAFIKD